MLHHKDDSMSVSPISSPHVAPQPTTAPAATRTPAANATANHEAGTKESRPAQSSASASHTGRTVDKYA
jgi:cell division septation protein DedD